MNVHLTGNTRQALPRRVGLLIGKHRAAKALIVGTGPTIRWITLNEGDKKNKPHQNYKKSALVILVSGRHRVTVTTPDTLVTLKNPGDYIFLQSKTLHKWECLEDNTTLIAITW